MQTYAQMERGILFIMKTGSWGFFRGGVSHLRKTIRINLPILILEPRNYSKPHLVKKSQWEQQQCPRLFVAERKV